MKTIYLLIILTSLTFVNVAVAQSKANQEQNKPVIALLGTFHFKGSSDMMSLRTDDLSTPKRQSEIQELINALAQFNPTKIILEYPYGKNKIDSLYKQYLNEAHTLTINERQQVGFRLAAKMGHKSVYPADHRLDLPFDSLMEYLQENGKMELFQNMMETMKIQVIDVWQEAYNELTIKEFYFFLNSDKFDTMNRNVYLEYINKMGTESNYLGVAVVSKWWERNFKIMYNIDSIIEPGDRVLVFFGQGHTSILKDFYKNRSDIRYTDILPYLKNKKN
jgi:uncharacterized protein DUF5694